MSRWQIVDLLSFSGTLKYKRGQLVVQKDNEQTAVPLAQLAAILVGQDIQISASLLGKLSELDIVCIVCDWKSEPIAALTPWSDHTRVGARQRAQASLTLPRTKNAWARIITAKIRGQAMTLKSLGIAGSDELVMLAKEVRSGDRDNREAVAAKKYWDYLTADIEFSRLPGQGENGINACLDYAYTVLRSAGIRAAIAAGLSGTLGVFHKGRSNPFALVDDLIEPFRPAVDFYVFSTLKSFDIDDPKTKRSLVVAVDSTFSSSTGHSITTELIAFGQTYGKYVEGGIEQLVVPTWEGVP